MSDKTGIAWTNATWNPTTGCSKVSQGCKNCYALKQAWPRLSENPKATAYYGRAFTDVQCHPERLDQPIRWTKPRRIFVNSMSDLFHEKVPFEFIDRVFAAMALSPQHQFQVLTKRPQRMLDYMRWDDFGRPGHVEHFAKQMARERGKPIKNGVTLRWPLPHVWLGVSVEDQATADERIPLLIETPAAVRWVSYEPALDAVSFADPLGLMWHVKSTLHVPSGDMSKPVGRWAPSYNIHTGEPVAPRIDWIVVGGESGPEARPFDIRWAHTTVEQCKAAGVPVFVKQIGARPDGWCASALHGEADEFAHGMCDVSEASEGPHCGTRCMFLRDRKGADMDEWPLDLRVQEYPK